jgi:hypothetical protein
MLANVLKGATSGPNISEFSYITNTFIDRTGSTADFSFSGVSIGTANENRVIILGIYSYNGNGNPGEDPISVTVGGVSASEVATIRTGNTSRTSIFAVALSSGTTANIVVTPNGTQTSCGIGVWRMVAANRTTTPFDLQSVNYVNTSTPSTMSLTVATASNSHLMGFTTFQNSSNPTWTNATKNFGTDIRTNEWMSGATASASGGSLSVSCTRTINQLSTYYLLTWR